MSRGHLVDARIDGGLLLELYTRDGIGTMISTDFYEGIRRAGPADVPAIKVLDISILSVFMFWVLCLAGSVCSKAVCACLYRCCWVSGGIQLCGHSWH